MFKVLAYIVLAVAALPVLFFASLAMAHPSPHGAVPTVIAAIIAPLPFALPLLFVAGFFLSVHRYLHRGDA